MYRRLVTFALAVAAVAVLVMLVPLTLAVRADVRAQNLAAVADQARRVADAWERGAGTGTPGVAVAESGVVSGLAVGAISDDSAAAPDAADDIQGSPSSPAAGGTGTDGGEGSPGTGSDAGSQSGSQGGANSGTGSDGEGSSDASKRPSGGGTTGGGPSNGSTGSGADDSASKDTSGEDSVSSGAGSDKVTADRAEPSDESSGRVSRSTVSATTDPEPTDTAGTERADAERAESSEESSGGEPSGGSTGSAEQDSEREDTSDEDPGSGGTGSERASAESSDVESVPAESPSSAEEQSGRAATDSQGKGESEGARGRQGSSSGPAREMVGARGALVSADLPPFPLQGTGDALADPAQVTLLSPTGEVMGPPVPAAAQTLVADAADGQSGTLDVGSGAYAAAPAFLSDDEIGVVLVSATAAQMATGLWARLGVIAGLALLLLGVSGLAGWWLARRTVAPIRALAHTADEIAGGDLAARAPSSAIPEVSDVSLALNRMARRTAELLADERAANAELAHQLRTPLTVLTADIDAVSDPDVRERLSADALALAQTTDEIINTARQASREGLHASCDAGAVVNERLEFWQVLADYQNRRISAKLPAAPLPVRLTEYDLTTAVDILLQNVFVHTPDGVGLNIRVRPGSNGSSGLVAVEVADDGPGFPEVPQERTGSTQLGLAIAERLARGSGGRLERGASETGGAQVTLLLGRDEEGSGK